MADFRCLKVRVAVGAYEGDDGKSTPCRAFQVYLRNVEEQRGPQWGVADIMLSVLHECHYVADQVYTIDF